jgi:UDP:flavonoid glycosyltransferase YjiC (YdhE family)
MAAGIPQLIHPLCFDQIDNGMRAKRLGVGHCLRATRASGKQIATALAALMTDKTRAKCRRLKARFDESNALATAGESLLKGLLRIMAVTKKRPAMASIRPWRSINFA